MALVRPFIRYEHGRYVVDEDAAAVLSERKKPFAVFVIVGKYRCGKSFLLNRLLKLPPGKGFGVGDTVTACTRGIWMADQFLEAQGERDGPDVLVMDTEGIEAMDVENDHDVRIFALAMLLSTVMAYNSTSHLDEAAIQTLGLTTRIAQALCPDQKDDRDVSASSTTKATRPSLYWVLRDFALQLVDGEGKPMSHAEYLEGALAPPSSDSAKCATRDAIKALFPTRHLVTLPRPHKGESAQKLDLKGSTGLTAKFEKFLDTFRAHLCTHAQPMCAAGVPIGGAAYVALARDLVAKVNDGTSIPKMEDSWTMLAATQHREALARLRQNLSDHARSLSGDEAWMRETLQIHVGRLVARESFVPPVPPTIDAECEAMVEEAVEQARRDDRLKDLAQEEAQTACTRFLDGGCTTPLSLLVHDTHGGRTAHHLVPMIVHRVIPALRECSLAQGRDESVLEIGRLRAEVEALQHAQREDEEEATLRVRSGGTLCLASPVPKDDAWTSTDDLWPWVSGGEKGGRSAEKKMSRKDSVEEDDEDDDPKLVAQGSTASSVDAARMIVELEACLASADARADEAFRKCDDGTKREAAMRQAFEHSMETLADETSRKLQEASARVEAAHKERDVAHETARACDAQTQALRAECDKLRALAREAQEQTVASHKTTLEELRRRDREAQGALDVQRREYADVRVRAEAAATENRALKRRLDELMETDEDVKRLRRTVHDSEVYVARVESERDAVKTQLQSMRAEHDALRAAKVELETRLAVAEATAKLESCRRM